jgi:hypothetical protein
MGVLLGSVWVFHGLYSKLLDGVPRHRLIVGRVLGDEWAGLATDAVGVGEVLLGLWVYSGRARQSCAAIQTMALVTMNVLEVTLARDLLISAPGMLVLNAAFLTFVWWWSRPDAPCGGEPR